MPTTLRIALLAGLLALVSNLAVIGFIYVRTHDEAVASLHRQVAELRLRKDTMDAKQYDDQLEKLLTDLALKTRAIRDFEQKNAPKK